MGTVMEARRDVDPVHLPDGPGGRCLADIVAVHRRDACLAARRAGLGPAPKGLPDEPEIFGRALEHRQDAAPRVPQPRDVLPRALRRVPRQVRRDAAARLAWVLMAQVLLRQVSQTQEMMAASRTDSSGSRSSGRGARWLSCGANSRRRR